MTRDEASAEAHRRWGESARTSDTWDGNFIVMGGHVYSFIFGIGRSWEDAFAAADKWVQPGE